MILCALCAIGESGFAQVITNAADTKVSSASDAVNGATNHSATNSAGLGSSASASEGSWTAANGNVTATSSGESSTSSDSITYGANSAVYSYSLSTSSNFTTPIASPQGGFSAQSIATTTNTFSFYLTTATTVSALFNFNGFNPGDTVGSAYSNVFTVQVVNTDQNANDFHFTQNGFNGTTTNSSQSYSFNLVAGNYTITSTNFSLTKFDWIAGYGPTTEMMGTATANYNYSLGFATPAPEPCSTFLGVGAFAMFLKRRKNRI